MVETTRQPLTPVLTPDNHLDTTRETGRPSAKTSAKTELRERWPLRWSDVGWFVAAYIAITALFVGLGQLVVHPLDSTVGALDRRLAEDFADGRTATMNDLSLWGSLLSETATKVIVTAVLVTLMVAIWRRWEDALLVALALILEAAIFLTVTLLVSRPRPDVERLDASPVDSSFPSGHVAAAVVYMAFAIVVARHTAKAWTTWLAVSLVVGISFIVAWSRVYRGMHHLSDVIAGMLLGTVSLLATWLILRHAESRNERRRTAAEPAIASGAQGTIHTGTESAIERSTHTATGTAATAS